MTGLRPLQIVLFCHVEGGTSRNREVLFDRSHDEGITQALPKILEFADTHELPLVFTMTPQGLRRNPVSLDGYPLGLHLHPQDPVLEDRVRGIVSVRSDCLSDYAAGEQKRLIETGIEEFVEVVGSPPEIFVAGNWSENPDTLRILEGAGVLYDGSVLPGHRSPCADWSRVPRLAQPYRPDLDDCQAPGSARLLYLPVSQGLWGHALTPEKIHLLRLAYFKAALKEGAVGGARVVHMYFHSPMAVDPFFLSEFSSVVEYARDSAHAEFVAPSGLAVGHGPAPKPFPPAYVAHPSVPVVLGLLTRRVARDRHPWTP